MPLIQYGPALGVGTVGENEWIDFDSPDELEEGSFLNRINASLPQGFRFKTLARISAQAQGIIKEINRAEYAIALDAPEIAQAIARLATERPELAGADADKVHHRLAGDLMARSEFVIERARKDKRQKVDVRRYTQHLGFDAELNSLSLVTVVSPNGGVKPIEVVAAIYGLTDQEKLALSSRVRRLRLYSEDANPSSPEVAVAGASGQ